MATITVSPYGRPDYQVPALPARAWIITPSDTDDYERPISVQVLGAGDVKVLPFEGSNDGTATAVTIPAAVAIEGYIIPFRVKRVYSTDTTATSLLGAY